MTLYYTGMREGELLALSPADIDLEKKEIRINKSYQRLKKSDVITTPKTPKSVRTITIPDKLCECLREYMEKCYGLKPSDRLFPYTKSFLYHEIEKGSKAAGVKKIRVHDIRHQNVKYTTKNILKSQVFLQAWDLWLLYEQIINHSKTEALTND